MKRSLLAIVVFSLLCIACDKELPENELSGKEVLVRVRLVGIAEGKEADVTRSASLQTQERVATPIGDGVVLEMKMERDTSALRAAKTMLDENARFRVVAVKHSTSTFLSYGDFTIHDGTVAGGLHVPDNDYYDFICYSYNTSNALPALSYVQGGTIPTSQTLNVLQGTKDLLWEKIDNIPVFGSAPELEILLGRIMARVQVVIDCSYNNWTITGVTGVTLATVNTGGTVRLTDKVVATNTGSPTLTWSGSGNQRESNEILVMPKGSGTLTVSIPVGAITRQGSTAIPSKSVTTGTFSTALVGGNSYKLYVNLRVPKFAGSNIYWEGNASSGKMMFDKYLTRTHEYYGGLFFRWGSLVGISPLGAWGTTTPVYVPSGSGWTPSTANAQGYNGWANEPSSLAAGKIEIPYMDETRGSVDMTAPAQNSSTMWANLRGDICQYIGSKDATLSGYRMPIRGEFGSAGDSFDKEGWTLANNDASGTAHNAYGTGNFSSKLRATNSIINGGIIFSGSGYRHRASGSVGYAGNLGCYWSASPGSNANAACAFRFEGTVFAGGIANTVTPQLLTIQRSYAIPVRCVVND